MMLFTDDMKEEMRIRECKDCLYYIPGICACSRGFRYCVWNVPKKPVKRKSLCESCPYGRKEPCIGVCMKDLLKSWREERKEVSVYA